MFDIKNNLKIVKGLSPATITANTSSAECDLKGFSGAMCVVTTGVSGDTLSGTVFWNITLEHGDTSGALSTVTSSKDVTGGTLAANNSWALINAAGDASNVFGIGYVGGKQFLKITITKTGTHSNGTIFGANFIKGHPISAPVSTDTNSGA
tara:strand:+ start:206 stop:658 length:453 start_codon:yes stop_codon:yes gene_type:complete